MGSYVSTTTARTEDSTGYVTAPRGRRTTLGYVSTTAQQGVIGCYVCSNLK